MRVLVLPLLLVLALMIIPLHSAIAQSSTEMPEELHKFTREAGKLTKIKSEVMNNTTSTLTFAYIVQIKDSENVTIQLSWIEGVKVAPKEKIEVMQSWIPEKPGQYTVEIFVWKSVTNPDPLSPVRKATAVVE